MNNLLKTLSTIMCSLCLFNSHVVALNHLQPLTTTSTETYKSKNKMNFLKENKHKLLISALLITGPLCFIGHRIASKGKNDSINHVNDTWLIEDIIEGIYNSFFSSNKDVDINGSVKIKVNVL